MNVNGIGTTGYPAWQGARKAQQNAAGRSFAEQVNNVAGAKPHTSIVYMKTDDMLYSGGNGTGLSFYIKYAEGSTEDDPTVIAKGVDENGNEFEQTIHINKINPRNASLVEMTALESYMGVDKNGGLTSLPPETGMMGLNDRTICPLFIILLCYYIPQVPSIRRIDYPVPVFQFPHVQPCHVIYKMPHDRLLLVCRVI